MKILLLDIETAPNTAWIWDTKPQWIPPSQIKESSYTLCWAAKWLGSRDMMWARSSGKKGIHRVGMLREIHSLLDQADAVIHFNGRKFDVPKLNTDFLLHRIPPYAPFRQMDLILTMRSKFKFTSNKLDYLCKQMKLGEKLDHEGQELWSKCMDNDPQAWKTMEAYNKHDVVITERLYHEILPWIKDHANYTLFSPSRTGVQCPKCGKSDYQSRGWDYTQTRRYRKYKCKACLGWFRSVSSDKDQKASTVAL
jgi:hypothetical protein